MVARVLAGAWGLRQQSGLTSTVATSSAIVARAAASGPPPAAHSAMLAAHGGSPRGTCRLRHDNERMAVLIMLTDEMMLARHSSSQSCIMEAGRSKHAAAHLSPTPAPGEQAAG